MENECGGDLIDHFATLLARDIGFKERSLGRDGGESFIPIDEWKSDLLRELIAKSSRRFSTWALASVHIERKSDDEMRGTSIVDNVAQHFDVASQSFTDSFLFIWRIM